MKRFDWFMFFCLFSMTIVPTIICFYNHSNIGFLTLGIGVIGGLIGGYINRN